METEYPLGKQLDLNKINEMKFDKNIFGTWINNIDEIKNIYNNAKPFSHICIDNFFNDNIVNLIANKFPKKEENIWDIYCNPLEYKYSTNNMNLIPELIQYYIKLLNHEKFIDIIKKITEINNLEIDEYLHG